VGHHHHHLGAADGDRRVAQAIAVNLGLTVAEFVGGVLAGSLALIADALHNLSDAISLIIAFAARRIARRPADPSMTFGYGRAEVVAALINYTTLILLAVYLGWQGVLRLINPEPVEGWIVVAIAGLALVVDVATALLTFRLSRESVNIRAAFLHNLADALGSVAVIFAGTLILLYDWRLLDPAVTLLIAGYILWMSVAEIGGVIRILMLGSPPDLDGAAVVQALAKAEGVQDVHNVHLWLVQEHEPGLDAHVALVPGRWGDADAIKAQLKQMLASRFGITHCTLDMECSRHACDGAQLFGHRAAERPDHSPKKPRPT